MESEIITKYFPSLTAAQVEKFEQLGTLYREWNARINVISRKDIVNLYERHVLHSLGIARIIELKPRSNILDAGTGGGFPGIPLAILFPEVHFHLVDSTAKKLTVVQAIVEETGITNISIEHGRLEDQRGKYDFIVSRAVASLDDMVRWLGKNIRKEEINTVKNGILYLKGGEILYELKGLKAWGHRGGEALNYNIYQLSEFFSEPFFSTKSLVHLF